ncbi:cysteine--tRNA ligase [Pontivivens nitratireducens]|uniref:Cysteine--tRNA ligase n=1 Tax=Pontivivens nitratireducens TaxID=2758038 RepID=A0A6G7VL56_9RHOB|nr:cysteine--tRNA ligase [Pontibrevibacter nitratireducens]QIK40833.1 cysteine--tRNA ligase [Pontibrevibacter nitratireducens]
MTDIVLHDTKTKQKKKLEPVVPGQVGMYVCGPTVYDRAHIGNARPVVVFDTLYRLLRHVYGADAVTYVRNFTDVDDKINARAAESGRSIGDITQETIGWYLDDMAALGALEPDLAPRATQSIDAMIAMIAELIEKGHAYAAEGHVLFSVASDPQYGSLSHRNVDEMIAGARVEVAPYKRDAMDFVLWKPSDEGTPGWESPWGRGRPGWHIECSAMSREVFGERFDIHGGGNDLMFPHHENEAAQSRCAHGHDGMASIWMHNGMLQVEGAKMSKSLGNFFTVKDLLDQGIPGEVIRFVLLSTHYRAPLDWTERGVEEAEKTLRKWRTATAGIEPAATVPPGVVAALSDDLNTPGAIAALHGLSEPAELLAGAGLLGLLDASMGGWAAAPDAGDAATLIEKLIAARADARAAKDFARSDAIRDGFAAAGVIVKDTAEGATWELSPTFDPAKLEDLA